MSKLSQIDTKMPLNFYACVNETITDPEMVALAERMQMPNFLMCDVPLDGAPPVVIDDPVKVELILSWLRANHKWSARIEETLQSMANDSEGRPLLTAFMPAEEFAIFADDLAANEQLADLHLPFAEWRAMGATTGYFDGYELSRQPAAS
ncbi:hypothetical protein HX866_03500 [Pseudomonas gingeri]|uniref:hypothetical protein n=1 Tax=Pseudomonas gingeri TaxID=117681 RepID=UPI0015A4CF6B|nr:hypothetical protein [Pseudomonas gingeri]NWA23948.1 hypothetical protein [Pseudomonas gingeri]